MKSFQYFLCLSSSFLYTFTMGDRVTVMVASRFNKDVLKSGSTFEYKFNNGNSCRVALTSNGNLLVEKYNIRAETWSTKWASGSGQPDSSSDYYMHLQKNYGNLVIYRGTAETSDFRDKIWAANSGWVDADRLFMDDSCNLELESDSGKLKWSTKPENTKSPTLYPTSYPSDNPSIIPSKYPSAIPSLTPSKYPSEIPSVTPSVLSSASPSSLSSNIPSKHLSSIPSLRVSPLPSNYPSSLSSVSPSSDTSFLPTIHFKSYPTGAPTNISSFFTTSPTGAFNATNFNATNGLVPISPYTSFSNSTKGAFLKNETNMTELLAFGATLLPSINASYDPSSNLYTFTETGVSNSSSDTGPVF